MKTRHFIVGFMSIFLMQALWAKTPVNEYFNPEVKAKLTDKILTEKEISQVAENTRLIYFYCITDTANKMKMMIPGSTKNELIEIINSSCEYPEDRFHLYNILLAAASMKKPMSEKQAAVFLENAYNAQGRTKANQEDRHKIFKVLGLMDTTD